MAQANFSSVLDAAFEKAERPSPLPIGTYLAVVKGLPEYGNSAKKQTPYVEFNLEFLQAADDVDAEALAEMGGCQGKTMKNTYYLTETSLYRLDEFLEHLGFDLEDAAAKKIGRRAMCEQAANSQVYVTIRHEPSQDGKSMFARINGTAATE